VNYSEINCKSFSFFDRCCAILFWFVAASRVPLTPAMPRIFCRSIQQRAGFERTLFSA